MTSPRPLASALARALVPRATAVVALVALAACSEYRVDDPGFPPPADPPAEDDDATGSPPDWTSCATGFLGRYHNLPGDHPALDQGVVPPDHPADVDWWAEEDLAFSRYDPTLDFGANWWPVDEGLRGDPGGFTVQWTAWVRVQERGRVQLLLGAADDAWILFRDEVVASQVDAGAMLPEAFTLDVDTGQFPVTIRYAHRHADASGFRFRVLEGDLQLCYPTFD